MIRTSIAQVRELVTQLGVGLGDAVLVHSALFSLGRVERGVDGFYHALREVVGPEGTIIVPTFTYSFRRGEIFDVRNSPAPAELGVFSEYLRRRSSAARSADPLLSMAAEGSRAEALMERPSPACLGENSVFAGLFAVDVMVIALGITYSTGMAGFMHLEKLAGVDYRCDMSFHGKSIGRDGQAYSDIAIHYARDEHRYPEGRTNREAVGRAMEACGVARAVDYGSGRHVGVRAQQFEEFVLAELARDPHVMFEPGDRLDQKVA